MKRRKRYDPYLRYLLKKDVAPYHIRKILMRRRKNYDINFKLGITYNLTFARKKGKVIYVGKMRSWAPAGAFQKTDKSRTHIRATYKSYSMVASALWFKNRVRSSRVVTSLLDEGSPHGAANYLLKSIVNNAESISERIKADLKSHAPWLNSEAISHRRAVNAPNFNGFYVR